MRRWILAGSIALGALGLDAQAEQKVWNFDGDTPGTIARGFGDETGEWKVVADDSAPSKPNVLAQQAKNSRSTFNLTLVADTDYKDVDISVTMKAVAGKQDQGGGLVWRAKNGKNYYVCRYNPLEGNFRVYKVQNGRRSELQSAGIPSQPGWHILRVEMIGSRIYCSFDGKRYLDVRDSTLEAGGMIGLWTKSDAQTLFDDLTVNMETP